MRNVFTLVICFLSLLSAVHLTAEIHRPTELIEPPMVAIPAGTLSLSDKGHQHDIDIQGFMAGKYEVTIKEFRKFIEDTNYKAPDKCRHEISEHWYGEATEGSWDKNNLTDHDFQPVTCIGWQAAHDYAQWLSKKTGKRYRLLTTSEWVYAARAGQQRSFYEQHKNNMEQVCELANIADKTAAYEAGIQYSAQYGYDGYPNHIVECDDKAGFSSVIGMYPANQYGLHDMIGNVGEFTQDCAIGELKNLPQNGSAYQGGDCNTRSLLGGAWHWAPFDAEWQGALPVTFIGSIEGFRIALNADQKTTEPSEASHPFTQALAQVQRKEQQRRDQLKPIDNKVETPQGLSLTTKNKAHQLTWQPVEGEGITYRVYRGRFLDTNSFQLLVTGLNSPRYSDVSPHTHRRTIYRVAAEQGRSESPVSDVSSPAIIHSVPGKIEAEYASSQEGTVASPLSDTGLLLGWINKGDWLTYDVDVQQAGTYRVIYRLASPNGGDVLALSSNGLPLHTLLIKATGGNQQWETFEMQAELTKGQQTLKVFANNNGWNIDWIEFVKL